MEVDGASGAARRRRERRLRAWLRHERQSVAAALAEALHHSSGPKKKVVERRERQEGRGTTACGHRRHLSRGRGQHHCLWLLGAPRQPDSVVPSVVPPALASPAAETVDAAAPSFLLAQTLAAQQQEEVEAKEQAAVAELEAQVAAAEDRLLVQLQREREEGTRVTRQTLSTLSRVEQLAVQWFLARDSVEKMKGKWKKKKTEEAEEYSMWFFWEMTSGYVVFGASWFVSGYMHGVRPLYLAVCSVLLPEECVRGFFWETTSGGFPFSSLVGATVDTCSFQFTEAFVLSSCVRFSSCSPVLCLPRRVQPRSCRQRHWYAWTGFAGVDALRAVFPSFVSVHSALLGPEWYMLCVSPRSGEFHVFST